MQSLVKELKENNQDFEFYPTTEKMLDIIAPHVKSVQSVLDIGAGTCNFKKYLGKENNFTYYAIEKSQILIKNFDPDVIVLGTDFNLNTLIDKKVDAIFCNPPYSEYEQWTERIVKEGNFKKCFLIIPERWQENKKLCTLIKENKDLKIEILGEFDFLQAERPARAKVQILKISKVFYDKYYNQELRDINADAFDEFFEQTFKFRTREEKIFNDKETLKTHIVNAESKAKMLVELYNNELKTLKEHLQAICGLDGEILATIGVTKSTIKNALLQKTTSLKILYWETVFNELEEITDRLTSKTREKMLRKFKNVLNIDFNIENIYTMILWVIKNSNKYYNEQLLNFFKLLSAEENVKLYKSNQNTIQKERWRYNFAEKYSHYTLDYRIVCDDLYFNEKYSYYSKLGNGAEETLKDIATIANNLSFTVGTVELPKEYGKAYNVYMEDEKTILFEYRHYKNGNTHIKFNKEFIKALNVEASRLLGWIKCKEDIKKEFSPEMAEGAEKYFKANNFISLETGSILKLEAKKEPGKNYKKIDDTHIEFLSNNLRNVLNVINLSINGNIESDEIYNKCVEVLKNENSFVYRDSLITCENNTIKIEFLEAVRLNKLIDTIGKAA